MSNYTLKPGTNPETEGSKTALEQILHQGAQELLQLALQFEIQEYVDKYQKELDEQGHRLVVKNGYLPEREILTGIGPIKIRQPRVDDRKLKQKDGDSEGFTSAILPRYMRRVASIDNLIPALYLKGVSTSDFTRALSSIRDIIKSCG